MRRLFLLLALVNVFLTAASGVSAGDPPIVNETFHFVDEPFAGVGFNCGTGNLARSDGIFSGVIRTFAKADGTVRFAAHTRGTDTLYDLPDDGIPDATTTFVFNQEDTLFSSSRESHTFTGNGTLTLVATGEQLRFHVVMHVLIDDSGDVKVAFERVTCD